MLGRVYTFERDHSSVVFPTIELVSTAAGRAVVAAINEQEGIRFEELTDSDNPKPIIALLFSDVVRMEHFDRLIDATLKLCGVRVSVVHGPEARELALPPPAPRNEPAFDVAATKPAIRAA